MPIYWVQQADCLYLQLEQSFLKQSSAFHTLRTTVDQGCNSAWTLEVLGSRGQ